ncbi:hypothetical protein OB971_22225 [Bacillus cereus]|uniref:hypothetical protein n=1 Tax=Bacillus tropicus TaxID=2026188 RepID=UPI0013D1E681|nr:hypothetical protein [Bacillus tropicus]MCU4797765.1 hypothetical protein [Bacillus cereus]
MSPMISNLQVVEISKIITQTVDTVTSYLKEKEVEKTERQRIIACLNIISHKLENERVKFETFMEKSFAERERLYQTMDALIVKGTMENDIELIKLATNCMLNIYQKNSIEGYSNVIEETQLTVLQPIRNYID